MTAPTVSPSLPDSSHRNELFLNCVLDEFGAIVHINLFHQIVFVHFDGLNAEVEVRRDVFYREPFGQQLQNLALPGTQAIIARSRTRGVFYVSADDLVQNGWAEVLLAAVNGFNREDQLRGGSVLDDVAGRAAFQAPGDEFLLVVHG